MCEDVLKILVCNNFVRNSSGIDAVVATEKNCLESEGHEVILYRKDNCEFDNASFANKIRLLFSTLHSFSVAPEVQKMLSEGNFDLIHVHNTVPFMTGAVYDACRKHPSVPIVQSLHNYRAVCPASYSFRSGQLCRQCSEYTFACCALHRCYRRSYFQSFGLVLSRWMDSLRGRRLGMKADGYVAVSDFVRKTHVEFGISGDSIHVVPNAVSDLQRDISEVACPAAERPKKLAYVGAMITAKGVFSLCHLAKCLPEFEFHMLGDGEDALRLRQQTNAMGLSNMSFHGFKSGGEKVAVWADAFFTLAPSLCDETFGLCAAESFSLGIPVATTGRGGLSEIVTHGRNGMVLDFGNPADVADHINDMWRKPDEYAQLRQNARDTFQTRYTEEVYGKNLSRVLKSIVLERGAVK